MSRQVFATERRTQNKLPYSVFRGTMAYNWGNVILKFPNKYPYALYLMDTSFERYTMIQKWTFNFLFNCILFMYLSNHNSCSNAKNKGQNKIQDIWKAICIFKGLSKSGNFCIKIYIIISFWTLSANCTLTFGCNFYYLGTYICLFGFPKSKTIICSSR